jgi:hypothetical protein
VTDIDGGLACASEAIEITETTIIRRMHVPFSDESRRPPVPHPIYAPRYFTHLHRHAFFRATFLRRRINQTFGANFRRGTTMKTSTRIRAGLNPQPLPP